MSKRPKAHDEWDHWHIPGEPYTGPDDAPVYLGTGSAHSLSDKPRRRKQRPIGFQPPSKRK